MSDLAVVHTPSFLNASIKENNMVLSKENREMTALSGKSGFGNAKNDFECDIQSSDVLDGSTLQLRGLLTVNSAEAGTVNLSGLGAYSLIPQITIEYNGQPILNLTQDADHIAYINSTLHDDDTQLAIHQLTALAGKNLNTNTAYSFALDLSQYGSALKYFLVTGSVARMKVRIRFQTDLPRCFNTATQDITGYELNDLRLTGDFMTFQAKAYDAIVRQLQGANGIKMATHSFVPSRDVLQAGALNHRIQGSYQYRNLVSVFYVPVPTTYAVGAHNVADEDYIANATYTGDEYPKNQRIRLAGMNYVNQNGSSGVSNKMEHFMGVYKASLRTPTETAIASKLTEAFSDDTFQISGASFVRGNDNLVEIRNSGTNAYSARGILETEFDTTVAQDNKTLLTVGVITTVLDIKNGQASVLK